MNSYFLTMVLKPDLEEKAREEFLESVKSKFVNGSEKTPSAPASPKLRGASKASGVKVDLWGARDLAYPIKKQTKGYYVHFEFETEPKVVVDLDKSLKVEENILRFLLVRR